MVIIKKFVCFIEIKKTYETVHIEFKRAQEKLRQARILQSHQEAELQTVKETVQQMNNESMSKITLLDDGNLA